MVDPMELFMEDGNTLPGHIYRMLALMKDLDNQTHNKMTELDDLRHKYIEDLYSKQHTHTQAPTESDKLPPKAQEKIQELDQASKTLLREKIAISNQFLHMVRHDKEKVGQYYQKLIQPSIPTDGKHDPNHPHQKRSKPHTHHRSPITETLKHSFPDHTHAPHYYDKSKKIDIDSNLLSPISNTKRHLQPYTHMPSDTSSVSHHEASLKKTKRDKQGSTVSDDRKTYTHQCIPHPQTHTQIQLKTSTDGHNLTHGMRISVASSKETDKKLSTYKLSPRNESHTKFSETVSQVEIARPTWNVSNQTEAPQTILTEEDLWDGICPICQKGESETQHMMVGCDACNNWFHFECVNYNPIGSEDAAWFCPQCIADRLVPYSSG